MGYLFWFSEDIRPIHRLKKRQCLTLVCTQAQGLVGSIDHRPDGIIYIDKISRKGHMIPRGDFGLSGFTDEMRRKEISKNAIEMIVARVHGYAMQVMGYKTDLS